MSVIVTLEDLQILDLFQISIKHFTALNPKRDYWYPFFFQLFLNAQQEVHYPIYFSIVGYLYLI